MSRRAKISAPAGRRIPNADATDAVGTRRSLGGWGAAKVNYLRLMVRVGNHKKGAGLYGLCGRF
jgi:hypothetical protein